MPTNAHADKPDSRRACRPLILAAALAIAGGMGAAADEKVQIASASAAAVEPPATGAAVVEPEPVTVVARIDLSDQVMTIYVGERLSYVFKVSTGRKGYGTPTGRWSAEWLSPRHRSKKYHWAPMPWSVFFHGGYAIHGTTEVRRLGRPASHGCVRLHPANAKIFFTLVRENGKENTVVSVVR